VTQAEIRLAGQGDEAEVTTMIAAFRDTYDETEPSDETIAKTVAELIGDSRTEFLLAGRPPLGFAQMRYRPSVWTGTEDAWLEDLYVVGGARRTGLGRALSEACIERARARGCARIQLDTNENNEIARGLYRSLGFREVSPQRFGEGRNLYLTKWL
jgi:ribosomal protein S18 acetylase RimI-like enzyme